jgi:hypothetical protein
MTKPMRRLQRSIREKQYINTINLASRVRISFVWYPGPANLEDSRIDTLVDPHPRTNGARDIGYTWTPKGGKPVTRVMHNGQVTIPLPVGGKGTLQAFGTTWEITRAAAGVNMAPENQLRGVQQRLNALGYHLRAPGDPNPGVDDIHGARTERAILAFQADYRPPAGAAAPVPIVRLQVRGEWTQNTDPKYLANLQTYNKGPAPPNPSNADGTALQQALKASVGS